MAKMNNNVYAIITHSLDGSELRKYMFRDAVYEVVRMLSDGVELRRYTFYDGSIHSAIIDGDIIISAVPIEYDRDGNRLQ